MRSLMFTSGSPFARAVRVILDELGLDYDRHEPEDAPGSSQLGALTPTMQVPTLRDGEEVLWESGVIAEYLMTRYADRPTARPPLSRFAWRPEHAWEDRLLFWTVQAFGTAATTISQLTWTGVVVEENAHLQRCARRMALILDWLDSRARGGGAGFFPDCVSMQDIFLICHVRFVQARPLGVDLDLARHERIAALAEALDRRASFQANPVRWWDPQVAGYEADGTPIYPTAI